MTDGTERTVCGIAIIIHRKKMKYIRVRIKRDCSVIVSAPLRISDSKIDEFIISKKDWIQKNLDNYRNVNDSGSDILRNGGRLFLFGEPLQLTVIEGPSHKIISDNGVLIMMPEGKDLETAVDDLYRSELKKILPEIFEDMQRITGLTSSGFTVRKMTSRWGSCNTRAHHISISLYLARKPKECIEYVVLHELIHTVIPNHGPDFKSKLSEYMPDWKERRRILNS